MAGKTLEKEARSNVAEFSVSELSGAIKRTLEDGFGYVRLRGEISAFAAPHSSGHCYFALKDDKAKIEAVVWRGVYSRLKVKPEEGMEVIAQGRITTYPNSSKYQIVIEALEPAGIGALMALLEERKKKLGAEGLFDETRKRPLPFLPRVVGVITSPTGAVIRDMLHGFQERFPAHVVLWPVRVQGEDSAAEVAAAIRGFNTLAADGRIPRPDVLIVARGGGSLEDLWGFQRGDRGARRRRQHHSVDLGGRPRNRLDVDRPRRRCPRADADQGGGVGRADVRRTGRPERGLGATSQGRRPAPARNRADQSARRHPRPAPARRPRRVARGSASMRSSGA